MSTFYDPIASISPSTQSDVYIYTIVPVLESGLAALTSANELLVLDKSLAHNSVLRLQGLPTGASCLVRGNEGSLICGGSDGNVRVFDVRAGRSVGGFKTDRPVTALACSGQGIAVGTELAQHQAVVSLWDQRQYSQIWQNAENNDDITALTFHPANSNQLLCGGDDGLAVNHGPIHKAGFLGTHRLFALSSDQNLAVHAISTLDDNDDPAPTLFGDLRPTIPCEYVIDVFETGDKYAVAAASNISNPRIEIVEIENAISLKKEPSLGLTSRHTLRGAHGEEVVRSIYADETTGIIFTAGEDGQIKAWRSTATESAATTPKANKVVKKSAEGRYKPY